LCPSLIPALIPYRPIRTGLWCKCHLCDAAKLLRIVLVISLCDERVLCVRRIRVAVVGRFQERTDGCYGQLQGQTEQERRHRRNTVCCMSESLSLSLSLSLSVTHSLTHSSSLSMPLTLCLCHNGTLPDLFDGQT